MNGRSASVCSRDEQRDAPWHGLARDALSKHVDTDADKGLTTEERERRLAQDGANEIPEAPPPSLLTLFLSPFTSVGDRLGGLDR